MFSFWNISLHVQADLTVIRHQCSSSTYNTSIRYNNSDENPEITQMEVWEWSKHVDARPAGQEMRNNQTGVHTHLCCRQTGIHSNSVWSSETNINKRPRPWVQLNRVRNELPVCLISISCWEIRAAHCGNKRYDSLSLCVRSYDAVRLVSTRLQDLNETHDPSQRKSSHLNRKSLHLYLCRSAACVIFEFTD